MIESLAYMVPHRHDLKAQEEYSERQHEIRFLKLSQSQTLMVRGLASARPLYIYHSHCSTIPVICVPKLVLWLLVSSWEP